jgi:hypothetical protein
MHAFRGIFVLLMLIFADSLPAAAASSCVPFADAQKHIGANRCITGKVPQVKLGNGGVHFFDFCEDFRVCPFTVVVFPGDLKRVGDVRQLQGKQIEIEGEVKGYDGRAEIILQRLGQLRGDAAHIPPLPREYDVERHGKFSAGRFSRPKAAKTSSSRKKQSPPVSLEDPRLPMSPTD